MVHEYTLITVFMHGPADCPVKTLMLRPEVYTRVQAMSAEGKRIIYTDWGSQPTQVPIFPPRRKEVGYPDQINFYVEIKKTCSPW